MARCFCFCKSRQLPLPLLLLLPLPAHIPASVYNAMFVPLTGTFSLIEKAQNRIAICTECMLCSDLYLIVIVSRLRSLCICRGLCCSAFSLFLFYVLICFVVCILVFIVLFVCTFPAALCPPNSLLSFYLYLHL